MANLYLTKRNEQKFTPLNINDKKIREVRNILAEYTNHEIQKHSQPDRGNFVIQQSKNNNSYITEVSLSPISIKIKDDLNQSQVSYERQTNYSLNESQQSPKYQTGSLFCRTDRKPFNQLQVFNNKIGDSNNGSYKLKSNQQDELNQTITAYQKSEQSDSDSDSSSVSCDSSDDEPDCTEKFGYSQLQTLNVGHFELLENSLFSIFSNDSQSQSSKSSTHPELKDDQSIHYNLYSPQIQLKSPICQLNRNVDDEVDVDHVSQNLDSSHFSRIPKRRMHEKVDINPLGF